MVGLIDPFAAPTPAPVDTDKLRREAVERIRAGGVASIAPQTATQQTQPTVPPAQLLFNPITNEMSAGGRTFAADDIKSVMSAPQYLQEPAGPEPVGPEWKVMSPGAYAAHVKTFAERRGTLENLGRGVMQIAEGTVGGVGAAMELSGATDSGAAVRDFAQSAFGESENEQLRSQMIAQNSTLLEKLWDGTLQAAPSVLAAVVSGGTVGLGARALGAGATAIRGASTVGAAASTFPLHLDSFFSAAQKNGYDTNDPAIKQQILAGAFTNTILDGVGVNAAAGKLISRALKQTAEEAGQVAARGALRNGLAGAWSTAWKEGLTEGTQTFNEKVLFDPEIRSQLSASDWKTLVPSLLEAGTSEEVLMSLGIGAILGGGIGGAVSFRATPGSPGPKPEVAKDKPVDLLALPAPERAPTPLAITSIPGAQTMGAMPVPPTPGSLTLGPDERATPPSPLDPRTAPVVTGEVLPPEAAAMAPGAARLRGLPAPVVAPEAPMLPPPGVIATDFTAGPEGVAPTGAPAAPESVAPVTPVTPGAQLRIGAGTPTPLLTGQTTDTTMGNKLREAMAARQAEQATAAQQVQATAEAVRQKQLAEAARQAEIEGAYAQREAQTATMRSAEQQAAYDQLSAEQKAYVDADAAWETFRPQEGEKQSGVTLRDLAPAAQREWMTAVQQGTANEALYKKFRLRRAKPTEAAPIVDTPTILRPAPAPTEIKPKRTPAQMAEAMARGKAARKVRERVAVLSKAQKDELMGRLGVPDMAAVDAAIKADPAAVNAVVDEIVAPKSTPPTGGKKPGATPKPQPEAQPAPKEGDVKKGKGATGEAAPEPEPEAQTPAEPPATEVTAKEAERVTKAKSGLEFDYYTVELSDGRTVEVRMKDKVWVFRTDESPIEGENLTGKTVGDAVARMANENKLPGTLVATSVFAEKAPKVDAEAAFVASETSDLLIDLEKALGQGDDIKSVGRREAALDLMNIMGDESLPDDVRTSAQEILESGVTKAEMAYIEAEYAKVKTTRYGIGKIAKATGMPDSVTELTTMVESFNDAPGPITGSWQSAFKKLAAAVRKSNPNAPVLKYVKADNSPNFARIDGVQVIRNGSFALADFNTLTGATNNDGTTSLPLPSGRVDLLVRTFTGKLQRPPKVTVARNQADLKARNPRLYARAAAARAQGDFDSADAMGYSFGDGEVIVFSDRISTEQQLHFVLAHETLGHYGMRAIMPAGKFEGVMDAVYNSDPLVKANVDMTVAVRGMSRAEATEEYLADYAAVLDMSVLRRVVAALKNGMNALGFRFSDDMVRHLVRTARRYVRNGKRDNLFTASGVFRDIHDIESGVDSLATGRFKEGFKSDNLRTDRIVYDVFGGPPRSMEDVTAALKEGGSRLSAKTESVVNKFFSLTMFRAQENAGLAALVRILMRAGEISSAVRNRADETMRFALNREFRIAGVRVMGGITQSEQVAASYLMYTQQDNVRGKIDKKIDGIVEKLREAKKPTRMFSIVNGAVVPNEDTIKAYKAAGRLSLAEAKAILAADSRHKDIAAQLDKDHPTWKAYEAGRDAFEEAELQFVEAQYQALIEDQSNAQLSMLEMLADPGPGKEKKLLAQDKAMFNTWTELYYAMYGGGAVTVEDNLLPTKSGKRAADAFSKAVNEVILAKGFDTKKEDAVRAFFKGKLTDDAARKQIDGFIKQLVDFRGRITQTEENKFAVQNKVAEFAAAEMSYTSAEMSARKMLVQGYTPIVRKQQGFQIRVNAFDAETGEFVQMDSEHKGMAVYRTAGSLEEVTTLANQMNTRFADTAENEFGDVQTVDVDGVPTRVYTMKVRGRGEFDFKERRVIIRAEASAAVTGVTTPLNLNINEFLRGLRQYGLNVTPGKMEQIVIDMTTQDARARKRLEQTGNPGYQVEGGVTALEAIAQHIDGRASLISKIQMRPLIDRLMNVKNSESQKLWFGDKGRLKELKDRYDALMADPTANEDAKFLAKAEYTDYAAKMQNTITTKNGVEVNLGNKYLSEAQSLMAFVNGNRDVNESDWGSGPVASWFRRWISSVQLGGTLAQPIMNNIGPFTNFLPWLGSFNAKNGFGGGAGFKNAYAQYLRAMSDVGGTGGVSFSKQAMEMHTAEYWDQVATGMREHPGVSQIEAEFIANETRNGILTPAQANTLLGTSRNYTTNPAIRQALDKWMFFYVSSEQATRRAAALAAFRVEMNRQAGAIGVPVEQLSGAQRRAAYAKASTFAADGVRMTLGEYGTLNRPAAWRSGFQSFLYMYKVWPTTSIQTLSRLDNTGKAMFLLPLLAMSGLAGLPFMEDGEDILDTILQRLGMTTGSIRLEAARVIDGVLPGMSPFILNGAMTTLLGADVAGRFSMGDFVPGTAALLPGQEQFQTFKEVAGPAWGFLEGTFTGATELAAAPFSETATVVDAMRGGPITLLRAMGDTLAYASTGAVIDKRGYVIEQDLTPAMLAIRVLGFTPGSVAAKYELIRLAKRETNYQKQVVAKFRTQLLKAEMSGDTATAASIRRTVKEWNEATDGTLLEIRNFEKNYRQLKKLAMLGGKERFLKSAGKQNQEAIEMIDAVAAAFD